MKLKRIFICLILTLMLALACALSGCSKKSQTLGVWWWGGPTLEQTDKYLSFCKSNGVNEIYLSGGNFSEDVSAFIKKANKKSIATYYLCGEYQWIDNMQSFDKVMDKYIAFQKDSGNAFAGVHLDVEAHQHPDWKASAANKNGLVARYITFVKSVTSNPKYAGISFDFDIPLWYDNAEYTVEVGGESRPAYQFVIDYADRVFVMSYRDSASKIYDAAKNEIEYAKSVNKKIFFGMETDQSSEGGNITFYEEGKKALNAATEELKNIVAQNLDGYTNYGISIHHMKSWYALKK